MTATDELDLLLRRAEADAGLRAAVNAALGSCGPSQAEQSEAVRAAVADYDAGKANAYAGPPGGMSARTPTPGKAGE